MNNKGFMMAEVIIVSAIVLTTLSAFYLSYMKIYVKYRERINYYDISSLYRLGYYRDSLIELPNAAEDNNLMNTVLATVETNKIEKIYGFSNSVIANDAIRQIDGYNDKVFLLYDIKNNLNGDFVESKLSDSEFSSTFKDYINYLKDSTTFDSNYVLISERCKIINSDAKEKDDCKYSYLDVFNGNSVNNNSSCTTSPIFSNAMSDDNINFGAISSASNGNGLYVINSTKNDCHPIYYYRGAVTNNNVLFANYCWKIVRTTNTGGIKLIYNGSPIDAKCTTSTGSSTQLSSPFNNDASTLEMVGYSYKKNGIENDSVIKQTIDIWYKENIADKKDSLGNSYASYLEDTEWCNDRTNSGINMCSSGGSNMYTCYSGMLRLDNLKNPTLNCNQVADRYKISNIDGNGILKYPIGLITADEVAYAGGVYGVANTSFYLYNGQLYWTMTPFLFGNYYYNAHNFTVNNGLLSYGIVNVSAGVRPSISLENSVLFKSGDGSPGNPYIVSK